MIRSLMLALLLLFPTCPHDDAGGGAPYSVPLNKLDRARNCRTAVHRSGRAQPVLLVHGTGVTRERNWSVGYWPALHRAGFDVCWVQLPAGALGDIQVSAEYVARAIEVMHDESGELVDVVGHSQGGLEARWAIRYFPSGAWVDDYVGLASPNHGATTIARYIVRHGRCFEACWQMRPGSDLLNALNEGDETPGDVSYTSLYTSADRVVTPPDTARLHGGTNVRLQDVCPVRPVEHALMAVDALTWELALDALTHPGPADPERVSRGVCLRTTLPGARLELVGGGPDTSRAPPPTTGEPPLMPYARL
jgi:triacylglycerol lipase